MSNDSYAYLPGFDTALAARKKARKALLEWSLERLPVIHADADEPFDTIETVGSPTATHNLLVGELDKCLGFVCPARSNVCDECNIAKKESEAWGELDDEELLLILGEAPAEVSKLRTVMPFEHVFVLRLAYRDLWSDDLDTLYEYEYGQHLPATMARGARASVELRTSGRIRF